MFEVGKKVICVKTTRERSVVKGIVYEVIGIKKGCCPSHVLSLDVGVVRKDLAGVRCAFCGHQESDTLWFNALRFIPYDDTLSELTDHDIIHSETEVTCHP